MEPSTPALMFSTNPEMRLAMSMPVLPSGASNSSRNDSISYCWLKPFSTEKLIASNGTIDSRVV